MVEGIGGSFFDTAGRGAPLLRTATDTLQAITDILVVPIHWKVTALDTFPVFVDFASKYKYLIVSAEEFLPEVTGYLTLLLEPLVGHFDFPAFCSEVMIEVVQKIFGSDNATIAGDHCNPNNEDLTEGPT
jgi:hypothetical protein